MYQLELKLGFQENMLLHSSNLGAIPEIVFPVRVNGVAVEVLEFPELFIDIKV